MKLLPNDSKPTEIDHKKPKKGRSPGYPGLDVRRALELVTALYKAERQHFAPAEAVAQHWKLKPNSSQFFTALAALKRFGLLDTAPQRSAESGKVRVSDLGRDIVLDEREDSDEREAKIRTAALMPSIHAHLWRKYDGVLPSDPSLRFYLIRDLKFTEPGAAEFIAQFKRTIQFANLQSSDVVSAHIDDKVNDEEGVPNERMVTQRMERVEEPRQPSKAGGGILREVPIPIQGSAWPALKAAFPLTESAWAQMLAVLSAMKPGLVEPDKD